MTMHLCFATHLGQMLRIWLLSLRLTPQLFLLTILHLTLLQFPWLIKFGLPYGIKNILLGIKEEMIPVQSKAKVCSFSTVGIVCFNPAEGLDVLFLVYVRCCLGTCLCDGMIKCWAGPYWVCVWSRNLKRWGLGPIWVVGPQKKIFTHCLLKAGWIVQIVQLFPRRVQQPSNFFLPV